MATTDDNAHGQVEWKIENGRPVKYLDQPLTQGQKDILKLIPKMPNLGANK
jgi:hypothetical protein